MNNNYYQNPIYSNISANNTRYEPNTIDNYTYIDDIIRKNINKLVKIHITIPGSIEWQDKTFEGIIDNVGKDFILISNNKTKEKELIPIIYITFITILNQINYN